MHRRQAEKTLLALGFEIDWSATGRDPVTGEWNGTIDPVGRQSICGDCRGNFVSGDRATGFYRNAVESAKADADDLRPCLDPECDFHSTLPILKTAS